MINKIVQSIAEALQGVKDGATVLMGGFGAVGQPDELIEGLIELRATDGGAGILIHQAAKSLKLGQVGVKLSFHVEDVATFAARAAERGLSFGAIHQANGYQFANAKDPDKNSVSISNRAFRNVKSGDA